MEVEHQGPGSQRESFKEHSCSLEKESARSCQESIPQVPER
jgi:hypothetical protein